MRWPIPLLVGCSSSSSVFVGEVAETDAVIGLALGQQTGRLYLCGGAESLGELNRWFEVERDHEVLTGSADGWSVEANPDGRDWIGTLTSADGESWAFTAQRAASPDGPYVPEEPVGDCPAGAVVQGGGQRLQGIACPPGLAPAQVVPVGVISRQASRIAVRTDGDPPLEFVVIPAEP